MYEVHVALNAKFRLKFNLELNRLYDIYRSFSSDALINYLSTVQ